MKKVLCVIVLAALLIGCSKEPDVTPQVNYESDFHVSSWHERNGEINTRADLQLALFTPEKMENWEFISCVVTYSNNGKVTLTKDDFEILSRIYVDTPDGTGSYWRYWFRSKPLGFASESANYVEYQIKYKVYGIWYETIFHRQFDGRWNSFFEP